MLSNILIALGFLGTGILAGLALAVLADNSDSKKVEDDKTIYIEIYEYKK